jgi:hypothetical protein
MSTVAANTPPASAVAIMAVLAVFEMVFVLRPDILIDPP